MDVNIGSVRIVDLTIEKRPQVSRMEIVDSGRRRRFQQRGQTCDRGGELFRPASGHVNSTTPWDHCFHLNDLA